MDECREGTLVEMDSDQIEVENVMKDLEKRLDLDSCEQVQVESTKIQTPEPSASTTDTSQRNAQETSAPTAKPPQEQDQGKSTPASEQPEKLEQLEISKDKAPPQPNPVQVNMGNPPIMHTPLNEEKNLKREREVATPASGPSYQPGAKRHKLNPY